MIFEDMPLYADRDTLSLEPWYSEHKSRMTSEGLHGKSAIAAELAYRDKANHQLLHELTRITMRDAPDTEGEPKLGVTDNATFELEELAQAVLDDEVDSVRVRQLASITLARVRRGRNDTRQLVVALKRSEDCLLRAMQQLTDANIRMVRLEKALREVVSPWCKGCGEPTHKCSCARSPQDRARAILAGASRG